MSIDFEDQLRADMGRVQVSVRPGLAREAHRRHTRSRHRTALAVAATGTAAAVAGATAGVALTSRTPAGTPVETTAYVVSHVTSALNTTNAIGYATSAFSGPALTTKFRVMAVGRVEWDYGDRTRELVETRAGQPLSDTSTGPQGKGWRVLSVSYIDRTWSVATLPHDQPPRPTGGDNLCDNGVLALFDTQLKTAADWKHIITSGLACGAFTTDGRQRVDGVDAIRLISHHVAPQTTIWVNPVSYLPVRLTNQVHVISGSTWKQTVATITTDFRWLPPTRANLKDLTAPIPAGFREAGTKS
jgi:hypothetical protein